MLRIGGPVPVRTVEQRAWEEGIGFVSAADDIGGT